MLVFHKERREKLIEQLQNIRIHHQWQMKEREFVFGATIGVSNLNGITVPRAIMGRASIAYQAARQKGVGSVVEFSPEIEREILANQSIVSNFLPALQAKEFVIYYQPKVNVSDRTMYGAEALVRWIRNGKMVPPMQFIPQLEREEACANLITMCWKVSVLFERSTEQGAFGCADFSELFQKTFGGRKSR